MSESLSATIAPTPKKAPCGRPAINLNAQKSELNSKKNELNDLTNKPIQYIIISGGTSNILDFEYNIRAILPVCASKGKVKLIGVRNNKYSTAIGNIIYFLNTLKLKGMDYSMFSEEDMNEVSSPSKTNDDTMLGKVFGYFFGE